MLRREAVGSCADHAERLVWCVPPTTKHSVHVARRAKANAVKEVFYIEYEAD